MEAIYWIQRLDALYGLCIVVLFFCLVVLAVLISYRYMVLDVDYAEDKEEVASVWKGVRAFAVGAAVGALGCVFVPTTDEAYVMCGVGGTIDYLKENSTAKQLPDKVITALDKWVDGQIEDEKEDNE